MEVRCHDEQDEFRSIKKKVASYFTLREDLIFFADEQDTIYMEDMRIIETLFPLLTAQTAGVVPKIKVLLQSNLSQIDFMQGNKKEKE